jgi:hypothetical protein
MTIVEFIESKMHLYYTWIDKPYTTSDLLADLDMADEMHKQQIKDAYNQGYREGLEDGQFFTIPPPKDVSECSNAENYYNETFNK